MGKRGRPPHPDILTPREWEVLELLRESLTNQEIAERLSISRDGAKYHVSEILSKLGLSSREEAASWQPADRRPWWAKAWAPLAWLGRGAGRLGAIEAGRVGAVAAAVALAFVLGGVALVAVLLTLNDDDDELVGSQFTYLDVEGVLWQVDEDGDRRELMGAGECSPAIDWSPTGHRLMCSSELGSVIMDVDGTVVGRIEMPNLRRPEWSPNGAAILYWTSEVSEDGTSNTLFLADDSGELIAELGAWDNAGIRPGQAYQGFPLWSPDGRQLAYRSADTGEAKIYTLATGREQILEGDYHPLGWALDGAALLVAASYQPPPEPVAFPSYEVNLLDVSSGEVIRRLPELDSRFQFWVSPDGSYVASLAAWNDELHGPGMAILELETGEYTPIANSVISNPTESIGKNQVSFTPDGAQVYWIDTGAPATSYMVNRDGTGLTKLAEFPTLGATLSPDVTKVAYNVRDGDADLMTLFVADVDGTNVREIDFESFAGQSRSSRFQVGWRPRP